MRNNLPLTIPLAPVAPRAFMTALLMLVLSILPAPARASRAEPAWTHSQTWCLDMDQAPGATPDELEDKLKAVALESGTETLLDQLYGDQRSRLFHGFGPAVLDMLFFTSPPVLEPGPRFGQTCLEGTLGIDQGDYADIQPAEYYLNNFCVTSPDAVPSQARDTAHEAATKALLEEEAYFSKIPHRDRKQLLWTLDILKEGFDLDVGAYCLDARASIIPLSVDLYLRQRVEAKFIPTPVPTDPREAIYTSYLDLSGYAEGEIVTELGPNLIVFQDQEGKSLGVNNEEEVKVALPAMTGESFDATLYVKNAFDFAFTTANKTYQLFEFKYANGRTELYYLKFARGSGGRMEVKFLVRGEDTEYAPWVDSANFNEYRVEKRGSACRFFFNGSFLYNYETRGDSLEEVRVFLRPGARFYDLRIAR